MKALFIGVFLLCNLHVSAQDVSDEQKAQEIVERFIAESGGRVAWSKVKDYYSTQSIERFTHPQTLSAIKRTKTIEKVESFIKEPWKILTKTSGFNYETISSISPTGIWKAQDGAIINHQPHVNPTINNYMLDMHSMPFFFSNAEEHGLEYTFEGAKQLNDETLVCIEVSSMAGITKKFYFNEESGLLRAVSHHQETNITWYRQYEKIDTSIGTVVLPRVSERFVNGQLAYKSTIGTIAYNTNIPDYLFEITIMEKPSLIEAVSFRAENRNSEED